MNKIIGIITLLLSIAIGTLGVLAFLSASSMMASIQGAEINIDPSAWVFHWHIAATIFLTTGIAGSISSVGIIKNKLWGYSCWAYLVTAYLFIQLTISFSGLSKYNFESTSIFEFVSIGVITGISWYFYKKRKRT
jgi:hypothetical protein